MNITIYQLILLSENKFNLLTNSILLNLLMVLAGGSTRVLSDLQTITWGSAIENNLHARKLDFHDD